MLIDTKHVQNVIAAITTLIMLMVGVDSNTIEWVLCIKIDMKEKLLQIQMQRPGRTAIMSVAEGAKRSLDPPGNKL